MASIAEGDKAGAARIYSRMRYMPSLIVSEGRIAGFSQGDASRPRAKRAMDQAYQLDPDGLFVRMHTIDRRGERPADASQERRIRANIAQLEKLIADYGIEAWPEMFRWRAGSYAQLGDYAKARTLYAEAAQVEPRYPDWNRAIDSMKRQMNRKGVTIPGAG
jgi:hypothetical protein